MAHSHHTPTQCQQHMTQVIATTSKFQTSLPSPTVPSPARSLTITRVFQGGVELNWLPPTEPNGEVHYVIEYKRENSGNWTSVNTTSDSTHYNLTGLHSGTNYAIRVVAVNSAGRVVNENPLPSTTVNLTGVVAGVMVACLLLLTLLIAGIVIGAVLRKRMQGKRSQEKREETGTKREGNLENGRDSPDIRGIIRQGKAKRAHHNTAGQHAEEQHYESTDTLGLDWFGNVMGERSEGHGDNEAVIPTKDRIGRDCNDTQTEQRGTPGLKYVMIDHSMNMNRPKAPATDAVDQRVTYATVDMSKNQQKEGDGSKTEPGPDVKMGDTYYILPTHCVQPN